MKILQHLRDDHHSIGEGRLALIGLLVMQVFAGYEWLMSGFTKAVRGGFPGGLAGELRDKSKDSASWYKSFLDGTIIPNAHLFGWLIMIGEILIGVALIAAAAVWLWRWDRLPDLGRMMVLAVTALAALGAIFMAINFHLASGATQPWLIPKSGFDESVDLDSLLPAMQLVMVVISTNLLLTLRRSHRTSHGTRNVGSHGGARPADSA